MQRGPEVEYVALRSAVCLEALVDVLAEVDGERVLAIRGVTAERIAECLAAGAAGYAAIGMFK